MATRMHQRAPHPLPLGRAAAVLRRLLGLGRLGPFSLVGAVLGGSCC